MIIFPYDVRNWSEYRDVGYQSTTCLILIRKHNASFDHTNVDRGFRRVLF